jgi:hypothetical protein
VPWKDLEEVMAHRVTLEEEAEVVKVAMVMIVIDKGMGKGPRT